MSHKFLQYFSIKLYEYSIGYTNSKKLVEKDQATMTANLEKLSKLEKRMTQKSGVIYRKKSKITDYFKKKGKLLTLSVSKAIQVNPSDLIVQANNQDDVDKIHGQVVDGDDEDNIHGQAVGDDVDSILRQDVFPEVNINNDYVPWLPLEGLPEIFFSLHDFDSQMKCKKCNIECPDNQICPF